MSAVDDLGAELTTAELRDLRRLAGFMVPASAEYGVPGADDEAIFADIVRSLGRDKSAVRNALAMLREIAGGDFTVGRDEGGSGGNDPAQPRRPGDDRARTRRAAVLLPR
jgi:hypothetical protein